MRKLTLLCLALFWTQAGWSDAPTTLTFLGHAYKLGAFHQKPRPMWEFSAPPETVNNWTTLLTVIDCTDAHTQTGVDQVAEGVLSNYESHKAQILIKKTVKDDAGVPFDYLVAAFDQPDQHRYELDFVRVSLIGNDACILIYGTRISDPKDYQGKTKSFLTEHSAEIGKAVLESPVPKFELLPHKEF